MLAHVASQTTGRLRLRVRPSSRDAHSMHRLREALDARLGAGRSKVSPSTGSVLVHYDHRAFSATEVLSIIRDLGVLIAETARDVGLEVPEGHAGASTTSTRIVDALTDLDRQLSALTGRTVDLKLLFPITLGGLGLWRAASSGLGLSEVPAYVLLWYAFDSFWKFHREPSRPANDDPESTPTRGDGHDGR